jgi:hypothetical protein
MLAGSSQSAPSFRACRNSGYARLFSMNCERWDCGHRVEVNLTNCGSGWNDLRPHSPRAQFSSARNTKGGREDNPDLLPSEGDR